MNKPNPLLLALGAALLQPAFQARAQSADDAPAPPGSGISEISDDELSTMRGRYTVGDNTVAWFGVSMISTWQTATGQVLESTMKVSMDFSHGGNAPKVTFTPTVSITRADAPEPLPAASAVAGVATAQAPTPPRSEPQRSVDASGLQNVSGLVQSVQVAGDANAATNSTQLTVREGAAPVAAAAVDASPATATLTDGAATASARYANGTAGVLLLIAGQGEVQQWIRNGSVGQSIQLTGDAQQISNRLQLDLVRQSVSNNLPLNQNVAQAITLARGIGPGNGQ
ncbi:hypothetical protein P6166_03790 [Stenotrophomonas sp. HITSZ_GD]|uniref:hypothetical protein n=1 Tax=Stenotrophomonas sp. HITSZ_GD TaxID=3037248 RepID=UPI00240DFA9C|nr:hypothetical protein [Stenotrophomonas sp. HITSZ_GD]MDG2524480.1 hypothetical protein [Stenotrophomonas sp. HITSZ_GD]